MNERFKKIILVIGFVAVSVGIAIAIYFVFFRPAAPDEVLPEDILGTGAFPVAEEGLPTTISPEELEELFSLPISEFARGGLTQVTSLTTGSIESPNISTDGSSMNYYDPADGYFYKINEDGTVTQLSAQRFPDADSVVWTDQGDKVVVEFPDGSNVIYNFETQDQVTLPTHWEDFDFAPDGDELIAKSLGVDPNNRWLVITSDDGTRTQTIAALGTNEDKVEVSWSPNDQVVAFSDTAEAQTGFGRRMILPVGKNEENFKGLIVEGLGFDSLWSPKGDRILYSVSGELNNYKPMLWVVEGSGDDMGDNRRSLGVETWVDKCTFSGINSVICAVPQFLPNNAGLQPGIVQNSYDYIYEIDLNSGTSTLLAIPETNHSVENLTVSDDGSTLYFTNSLSGILESMKLN